MHILWRFTHSICSHCKFNGNILRFKHFTRMKWKEFTMNIEMHRDYDISSTKKWIIYQFHLYSDIENTVQYIFFVCIEHSNISSLLLRFFVCLVILWTTRFFPMANKFKQKRARKMTWKSVWKIDMFFSLCFLCNSEQLWLFKGQSVRR